MHGIYVTVSFQVLAFSMSTPYCNVTGVTPSQIYCLNPPSDSCEFGPCPNLDVTGTGQQVALCFAATVFAITVVHNTSEVRLAYYSYLANIYSLLISAIISMCKVQLTRNDAVFVVVVLANPGTLYLWVIALMALAKHPPRRIRDKITRPNEWKFFVALSIVSMVLWFIMLGFVSHPPGRVKFSQPACSHTYGKDEIIVLIWSGAFLLRVVFALFLLLPLSRRLEHRRNMDNGEQAGLNLTMWTLHFLRTSKFARYGVSPHFFASILFMMQFSHITYLPITIYGTPSLGSTYLFSFFVHLGPQALIVASPAIWTCGTWLQVIFLVPIMSAVNLSCILLASFTGISFLDLMDGVCWLLIGWFNQVSVGKFLACSTIVSITLASAILQYQDSYYLMPVFPQIGWFLLWRVHSFRRSDSRWDTLTQLWSQTMDSVPVFKFTFLILSPTLVWVQSIAIANPTNSYEMTFGQIFALSIAIIPTFSLAVTCYEHWREILKAVWVTDTKCLELTGIPMHVRSPSIRRGTLNISTGASHDESPAAHPASDSPEKHDEWSFTRSEPAHRKTM